MTISLKEFIDQIAVDPTLRITAILILGVILVNGWTDAPNAIASLVATGGMELKEAVRMAAIFNFTGLFVMTTFNAKVAFTIYHMVDFGNDSGNALTALCASLTAIIVWAAAAWCFGIPTSESHALIAGLSGAAIAIHNGFKGINGQEWIKVLYGLVFSSVLGLGFGWLGGKMVKYLMPEDKYGNSSFIVPAQTFGAASMAFMHGAQDGQKFMGVFLLGIFLAEGKDAAGSFKVPFWMMILCSIVMAAGTAIGGERIIKTVGKDMVSLKKTQGIAADGAGAVCLLISSLTGIPVSTTHVKTTAIMGVGMADDISSVNMGIVKEMILAWIITFPCCGIIGYLVAKLFILLV